MYFEAVIFDMDGVLVDSEPAHREASRQLVAPHTLSDEEYGRYIGSMGEVFIAFLRERYGLTASDADLSARYDTLVMAELAQRRLPALDGARQLLDALRTQGDAAGACVGVAAGVGGARADRRRPRGVLRGGGRE